MRAELTDGSLVLRLGRHFGAADAERLAETIRCFSPFSRLTLDFTDVRDLQDSAWGAIAATLAASGAQDVALRGLTAHQSRMLKYLGVR